jgi:outer membrane protein OmpA-like peptidoglycan-associated protein
MVTIYESISSLIKPGRVSSAAATLGESEQKVSSSVDVILPALLSRLLKADNDTAVRAVVEEAGRLKMADNYNQIWEGNGIFNGKNMGERMENRLLGVENPKFYSAVADVTGIKAANADRLTNWIAGTVAAYLGQKNASGKTYLDILAELESEKGDMQRDIPAKIITLLGLDRVFGIGAVRGETDITKKNSSASAKKNGKKNHESCWWLWLLLILALLVIILCWRSCNRRHAMDEAIVTETVVVATPVAEQSVTTVRDAVKDTTSLLEEGEVILKKVEKTLADGRKITFTQKPSPDYLRTYFSSDSFKNATRAQLRSEWFEFPTIDFAHGSSTELMPGAETRVAELATVLKEYPDVNVKVGAFADKTGSRLTNFEISLKRAETIKTMFEKAGVETSRISTEGFSDGFAKAESTATDAERAPDRDIALHFTK